MLADPQGYQGTPGPAQLCSPDSCLRLPLLQAYADKNRLVRSCIASSKMLAFLQDILDSTCSSHCCATCAGDRLFGSLLLAVC